MDNIPSFPLQIPARGGHGSPARGLIDLTVLRERLQRERAQIRAAQKAAEYRIAEIDDHLRKLGVMVVDEAAIDAMTGHHSMHELAMQAVSRAIPAGVLIAQRRQAIAECDRLGRKPKQCDKDREQIKAAIEETKAVIKRKLGNVAAVAVIAAYAADLLLNNKRPPGG